MASLEWKTEGNPLVNVFLSLSFSRGTLLGVGLTGHQREPTHFGGPNPEFHRYGRLLEAFRPPAYGARGKIQLPLQKAKKKSIDPTSSSVKDFQV